MKIVSERSPKRIASEVDLTFPVIEGTSVDGYPSVCGVDGVTMADLCSWQRIASYTSRL